MISICKFVREEKTFMPSFSETICKSWNKIFKSLNYSSDFAVQSTAVNSSELSEKELTKMCCKLSESSLYEDWESPENDVWN